MYSKINDAIRMLANTPEAKEEGSTGLIRTLDVVLPNFDLVNELKNPKTAFKTLRTFDASNSFVCPEVPTCAGLIDTTFFCANGIEADINVLTVDDCSKPYNWGFSTTSVTAQPYNPANGLVDSSEAFVQGSTKECVTLSAIPYTIMYKTDSRMCLSNSPCGSLIDDLVGVMGRGLLRSHRQLILASANAVATTTTFTGNLLNAIQTGHNALADLSANQGKDVVGYCNPAIIRRLQQLKDDNGRPLVTDINVCPVTGCLEMCYGGVKLKSVESEYAPIVGTTTKTTDILFVVPKNIYAIKSSTQIHELAWYQLLNNLENTIASIQYQAVKIPDIFASSTATKVTITL